MWRSADNIWGSKYQANMRVFFCSPSAMSYQPLWICHRLIMLVLEEISTVLSGLTIAAARTKKGEGLPEVISESGWSSSTYICFPLNHCIHFLGNTYHQTVYHFGSNAPNLQLELILSITEYTNAVTRYVMETTDSGNTGNFKLSSGHIKKKKRNRLKWF